jgi:hypothetical protein
MERHLTSKQDKFINGRLAKFLFNEYQIAQAVSLFENGKSTAEVFRIISKFKGAPSTHVSGKYKEGKVRGS